MENLFSFLDVLGWIGTIGLFTFYLLLAKQRIMAAYAAGIVAGFFWFLVGIFTPLPSLLIMEIVIIIINIYGICKWRRKKVIDG